MEWVVCPLIEAVPGRLSGVPGLRDSRVRPDDLIANLDEGQEWMAENFGLSLEQVRGVLAFYQQHLAQFAHIA